MPLIAETYPEPTQSAINTAGLVKLVRTLWNGDVTEEWLTPVNAVFESLYSSLNGNEVASAHIDWNGVSSGTMDTSASAFAAEYSALHWDIIG